LDEGKQTLQQEKRKERSKDVKIAFIDNRFQHFNVLDDENNIKHLGVVFNKEPHQKDFCTCESFYFGNSDEYKKSHPAAFQCKHILKARETRFEGYPK